MISGATSEPGRSAVAYPGARTANILGHDDWFDPFREAMMEDEVPTDQQRALFTLSLVEQCVRNTFLEDLHAGIVPASATGDYSDVKVVTPSGEIPWTQLSPIG